MAITFNSVSSTRRASAVFVEQEAVSRGTGIANIPHKIFTLGQYNTGFTPTVNVAQLIISKDDAWTRYGRGSMLSRMIETQLDNSGGVPVYACPLAPDGGAVTATGTIVVVGTASAAGVLSVYVEGKLISVAVAATDTETLIGDAIEAAVNADLDLAVQASNAAGTVTFTARWGGESGNQIDLSINLADSDALPAGLTSVTVTNMGDVVAGATDPVLTTAFAGMGDTWYTEVCNPYNSTASLTAMETAGVNRDDPGVKRQFVGIVGYTDTYANFLTALGSRNSQWTSYIPVHLSVSSAYMIAASASAIWASKQQTNPGRPVKTLQIPGVIAATGNDLTYNQRDAAVIAGGSYTKNREDGTVQFGDVCTTRTETDAAAATEDWQFAVIIPNLQFKIYSCEQLYLSSPYDRGVVVADGPSVKPTYAVTPLMVKSDAIKLVDNWVDLGLSTERDTIVAGIVAEINSSNPGRIDTLIPDIASAGLRIVAVKLEWGFVS